jgi:hypothetical protein
MHKINHATECKTVHAQSFPSELIGEYQLIDGSTKWVDGVAVRCMRNGTPLVLNEISQGTRSMEMTCTLHEICDDWEIAGVTLPTGERVRPNKGFCVIGTTNEDPNTIPEALLDRFEFIIYAGDPAQGMLDSMHNRGLAKFTENLYARIEKKHYSPPITARRILAVDRIAKHLGDLESAANIVFSHNQRAVREIMESVAVAAQV